MLAEASFDGYNEAADQSGTCKNENGRVATKLKTDFRAFLFARKRRMYELEK